MHYSLFVFVHYPLRHYSLFIMHYPLCIIHVVPRAHLHTLAPVAQHCAQRRSRGGIALQLPVPLLRPVLQKGAHRGLHLCHIPAPLRLRARVLAARRAAAAVCLVAHAPCLLFHVYGGGGRARRARFCRRVRAAPLTLPCRLHPCSRRRGLLDYHFAPVGSRVEMELAIVREAHLALVQVYVVATRVPAHRASWHIWHGPLGRFQIRQRRLRQRALPCCLLTH